MHPQMTQKGMMDRVVWNAVLIFHQVTNSIVRWLILLSWPSRGDNVGARHAVVHFKWSFITFSLAYLTVDVYVLISS